VFIQVIQGRVRHAEPAYVELDQWVKENARGAEGWLGTTAGVTADHRFIALTRWESAEHAQRNSARPEQVHWWRAFQVLFDEPPTFHDSSDTFVDTRGDVDQARFVQVMQGRGSDPERARQLMGSHREEWAALRPDVLGSVECLYGDGEFTMASYFTDEKAAREGERKQPPPELKAEMDELMSLLQGPPEYYDLTEPWLQSPT
jgi:hypothetical protein